MQNKVLLINNLLTYYISIDFRKLQQTNSIAMAVKPSKFNLFTFFKLPSAWWCGVRLHYMDQQKAVTTVRHKWINQNPFKSMFWAVQGMAAELSTGAMVIDQIQKSGKKISMLVQNNNANFSKKATGKITFTCEDGHLIANAIEKTIATGEGKNFG